MVTIKQKGNFYKTQTYLAKIQKAIKFRDLDKYGKEGVKALSQNTPVDSGITASSWYYEVKVTDGSAVIEFHNSNIQNGVPIAIILQYGHATKNGGFIQGIDYINPAIQPIFEKIAGDAWKEVTTT